MLDNDTGDCMALTIEHGYIIFMICNDWNNKDFLYEGTLDLDIFKLDESSFKEYTDKYLFDRELKIE